MHTPVNAGPDSPPRRLLGWRKVVFGLALAVVLTGTFLAYASPTLMVTLANQIWACF